MRISFSQPAPAPSEGGPSFVLGRRPALDGLRGVAILAVIGYHFHPALVRGGFIGVDFFFVLSGFLITALLLQERQAHGRIALSTFYLRRALRLLPALLAMLVCLWLYLLDWGGRDEQTILRKDLFAALFYWYNWREVFCPAAGRCPMLAHLWSLSVEEQFYLIWPAVLTALLACRVRMRWIAGLVLLGVAGPAALRAALIVRNPQWAMSAYYSTTTHADGLAAGCLVGLLAAGGAGPKGPRARGALRVGSLVACAVLVFHLAFKHVGSPYMYHAGFLVVNLCTATLLAALIWSPPPLLARLLESRPLGWVGRISYGAYLWNFPLCVVVERWMGEAHPVTQTLVVGIGSLAAGALSHYYLESPFLRLKRRLEQPPAARDAAPQEARVAA